MAGYRSVAGVLAAVEDLLKHRFPPELSDDPVNGKVQLLSSNDFRTVAKGSSVLGLWLHRIEVDPNGRNTWTRPVPGKLDTPQRLIPLNLHLLLVSWGNSAASEAALHAWGVAQLASVPEIDAGHLSSADEEWSDAERVQIAPEEMPTEDLLRIWDALPAKYTLTSCWVVRTVRVTLDRVDGSGVVKTRVLPMEFSRR